jgi:transcriptional regulator NrdR family protein
MTLAIDVVKSGKRPTESFQRDKLHSSIVAACLSVQTPIRQAELIAETVCNSVQGWLETRPEVRSDDLRRVAVRHLTIHHPDAAYLYEQHKVIL